MLLPKAMKLVDAIFAGAVTVTVKAQEAVRNAASVALHVTVDGPNWKSEPLAGLHVVLMGGSPAMSAGGS
jgi:hypothetical protein